MDTRLAMYNNIITWLAIPNFLYKNFNNSYSLESSYGYITERKFFEISYYNITVMVAMLP